MEWEKSQRACQGDKPSSAGAHPRLAIPVTTTVAAEIVERLGCNSGWGAQRLGCTVAGVHRSWGAQRLGCSSWGAQMLGCTVAGVHRGWGTWRLSHEIRLACRGCASPRAFDSCLELHLQHCWGKYHFCCAEGSPEPLIPGCGRAIPSIAESKSAVPAPGAGRDGPGAPRGSVSNKRYF